MSTDTTTRVSIFSMAASTLARSLLAARGLAIDLSDLDRWQTLAARTEALERAIAEARLRFEPTGKALEEAIREMQVLDRAIDGVAPAQREEARAALARGRAAEVKGREPEASLAYAQAERSLMVAVAEADRILTPIEAEVGGKVLADALRELGYDDLRVSRGGDLRARRSDDGKLAYARLGDAGSLEIGLAGHDGLTCQIHTEEIFEALRRRGMEVGERVSDVHGCRAGGKLVREMEREAAHPSRSIEETRDQETDRQRCGQAHKIRRALQQRRLVRGN